MKKTNIFITKRYSRWFLKTIAVGLITVLMLPLVSCKGQFKDDDPDADDLYDDEEIDADVRYDDAYPADIEYDDEELDGLHEKKESFSIPEPSAFENIICNFDTNCFVDSYTSDVQGITITYWVGDRYAPKDITYVVFDSESDAKAWFEEYCLKKVKTDAYDNAFSGIVNYSYDENSGYITYNAGGVINGDFFKDDYYYYGGIYYSGKNIIFFKEGGQSRDAYKNSEMDSIDALLKALGLPKPQR